MGRSGIRKRPAKYPPKPKLARAVSTSHKPDKRVRTAEVSRQLDEGEATAKPNAAPNARSTNDSAAATIAPTQLGVHSK
jgi:hypothetical protein